MAGGKRAGAGRKLGSSTKKTREIADRAIAQGITPLEVILKDMRELDEAANSELNQEKKRSLRSAAREAGKDAAPYLHPKLQPVDGRGSADMNINVFIQKLGAGKTR